jgi:hypothetical protein
LAAKDKIMHFVDSKMQRLLIFHKASIFDLLFDAKKEFLNLILLLFESSQRLLLKGLLMGFKNICYFYSEIYIYAVSFSAFSDVFRLVFASAKQC